MSASVMLLLFALRAYGDCVNTTENGGFVDLSALDSLGDIELQIHPDESLYIRLCSISITCGNSQACIIKKGKISPFQLYPSNVEQLAIGEPVLMYYKGKNECVADNISHLTVSIMCDQNIENIQLDSLVSTCENINVLMRSKYACTVPYDQTVSKEPNEQVILRSLAFSAITSLLLAICVFSVILYNKKTNTDAVDGYAKLALPIQV